MVEDSKVGDELLAGEVQSPRQTLPLVCLGQGLLWRHIAAPFYSHLKVQKIYELPWKQSPCHFHDSCSCPDEAHSWKWPTQSVIIYSLAIRDTLAKYQKVRFKLFVRIFPETSACWVGLVLSGKSIDSLPSEVKSEITNNSYLSNE